MVVLDSPSLTVFMVDCSSRLQLCGSRGGRPGFPVPNGFYGLCGRKATSNLNKDRQNSGTQELCESRGGRPGLPVVLIIMVSAC